MGSMSALSSPRALLRHAQTFLRALGIDIAFSCRIIRMRTTIKWRIHVDAMKIKPERSVQLLRRAFPVCEPVKQVLRRWGLIECPKILDEFRSRTPHVL